MSGLDYWERLQALRLYSQERRRERYQIIFLWKVAQGLVHGYHATFVHSDRRGRQMQQAPLCNQAPSSVRKARESSLQVRGARLFNCIPRDLRDSSTGTPEQFKTKLDTWLSTIPDQPTVPGRQRAAASNSLLEQVQTVLQNWKSNLQRTYNFIIRNKLASFIFWHYYYVICVDGYAGKHSVL